MPGAAGEYGVIADHAPHVAHLKPGVLAILHEGTSDVEKYFVAGGFYVTHADSTTMYRYWTGISLSLGSSLGNLRKIMFILILHVEC